MNTQQSYMDSIEHIKKMLSCLSEYINICNTQGTNDINVACENLAIILLNAVYGYRLENYNGKRHISNAAGIDLIDTTNKICVQVTSNQTKKKLYDTLKAYKENPKWRNYKLLFFIITNKASNTMRSYIDKDCSFNGTNDAIDFHSLCDELKSIEPERAIELDRRLSCWLGGGYYLMDNFNKAIENENRHFNESKNVDNYYPRKISAYSLDDNSYLVKRAINPDLYKDYTLKEYVTGKVDGGEGKYWLLIAAGQAGKTCEVRNLCAQLEQEDSIIFPVFFEAKRFEHNQELCIPYYWQADHIIFVIDGYDEIVSEEIRREFLIKLERLKYEHPALRMVLTSRRNYISSETFLPDFQRLYLDDLCFEDIKDIVCHSDIERPEQFLQLIIENSLFSLVYVPFYLNGLLDYYRRNATIPTNRQSIYKFLIDNSFQADTERRLGSEVSTKLKGSKLLQRIALVMQFTEKKELAIEDIVDMGYEEEELRCCLSYTLFHKDDKGCYRFEKNAFQLYYVAEFLSKLDVDIILDLISFRSNGINRIKHEWLDAFELLLTVIQVGEKKKCLLDWTFENHTEALLNVDPSCLEPAFCHEVFKKILRDYKEKGISSSPDLGWSFDRIAAFCVTKDSLSFFLQEYKEEKVLGAYLYLLSFLFWSINPVVIKKYGYQNEYKKAAYRHLVEFGNDESKWHEAPFVPFENEIFANCEDIRELTKFSRSINHVSLKTVIFRLIVESRLFDKFIDFSLSNEDTIHDFFRKNDSARVSVRRDNVILALSRVSHYESIKKVWLHYPNITRRIHSNYENDAIKIAPTLLMNTEKIVKQHPDLKDLVDNAWQAVHKKLHYLYNDEQENDVFVLFYRFMTAHSNMEEIKTLTHQLRSAFFNKGTVGEVATLQSKLIIRLKPGVITSLSTEWGDDEYYRAVVFCLRCTPSKELNEEIENLIKTKYKQYLVSLPTYPDYNKKRADDKEVAFDRKQFKQYITNVLNKYAITTRKQLRLQLKEDDELQLNDYLWQYIAPYSLQDSDGYDMNEVRNSLKYKFHYSLFIINAFHDYDDLTDKQIEILRESVEILLSSKRFSLNDAGYRICTNILAKHGFNMDEEHILKMIPYAIVDNVPSKNKVYPDYIAYAVTKCERYLVKSEIVKLLEKETQELYPDNLGLLIKYAACYSINEAYGEVLRHIKCMDHPIYLVDCFYRENEREGNLFLMTNFDSLPTEVQLYVIPKLLKDYRNRDWAIDAIKRNRQFYDEKQNVEAVRWLVYTGDENALLECLEAVRKDYKALWNVHDVPSFRYTDTKCLPQILELLQLTWEISDHFSIWYSRLKETLTQMANQNIKQFTEVVQTLENLVESDEKYTSINYFIRELYCNVEPQVAGAKPMTVKEAVSIITSL